jgi:hypothetical protein
MILTKMPATKQASGVAAPTDGIYPGYSHTNSSHYQRNQLLTLSKKLPRASILSQIIGNDRNECDSL